jgi:hypothetical protein
MKNVFSILIVVFLCLISCKHKTIDKKNNDIYVNNKDFSVKFDSVLNKNGQTISEKILLDSYLKSQISNITIDLYEIDNDYKLGIYLNILLDKGEYSKASMIVRKIIPKKYKLLPGGTPVPIFSDQLNPFLTLGVLKYNEFCMGLDFDQREQMYFENRLSFSLTKDTVAEDLFKSELLYHFLIIDKNDTNQYRNKYYKEFNELWKKYPRFRRFEIMNTLCKYRKSEINKDMEEIYFSFSKENYELEYLLQNLLSLRFYSKKVSDTSIQKKMVLYYSSKFPYCNLNYLRFFKENYLEADLYESECMKCMGNGKNYDSSRAAVYLGFFYLKTKRLDLLGKLITVHKKYYENNKRFYLESEQKRRESSSFDIIELRMLLYQNKIPEYIEMYKNANTNVFYKFNFADPANFKLMTKYFYSLDINKDTSGFESFFNKKVLPNK